MSDNLFVGGEIGISAGGNTDYGTGPRWENINIIDNVYKNNSGEYLVSSPSIPHYDSQPLNPNSRVLRQCIEVCIHGLKALFFYDCLSLIYSIGYSGRAI